MPQYQQPYNPYNYQQQQPSHGDQGSRRFKTIIIGIILIMIIAGALLLLPSGKKPVITDTPGNTKATTTTEKFTRDAGTTGTTKTEISKALLIDKFYSIDEYYTKKGNQYSIGDTVYIMLVNSLKSSKKTAEGYYKFDSTVGVEVSGPDGKIVKGMSKADYFPYETEESTQATTFYTLYSITFLNGDAPGNYNFKFTLTDNIEGGTSKKEISAVLAK
jgi:hypothetical protein